MGALFIWQNFVIAYDQQNTHPALTDEAIDFYNLNFPDNPLSNEDKQLLIRGAIEEDTPVRWLNHFYDPIYKTGWIGYTSSKDWAYNSNLQIAFYAGANYGGFANLLGDNLHPQDYSYQRALYDYATGNRTRAMLAMGHVMHLLEDSNVPEHTRGDTHLPWHGTESPYEKEMAKWNPSNASVVDSLRKIKAKPVLLSNLDEYFDKIAGYSNKYFFSQDTINSGKYIYPKILKIETKEINGKKLDLAIGIDKDRSEFILAQVHSRLIRNILEIKDATLVSGDMGSLILDDYWSRLSKDFVIHGAGALKLFLEQAEQVKQAYQEKYKIAGNQNPSPVDRFFAFFGWERNKTANPPFDTAFIDSIINQPLAQSTPLPSQMNEPMVAGESDSSTNDGTNDGYLITNGGGNDGDGGGQVQNDDVPLLPSTPPSLAAIAVGGGGSTNDGAIQEEEVKTPGPDKVESKETPTPTSTPTLIPTQEPSSPAPSIISDLAVSPTSFFGEIKLIWSAPSDTDSPQASLSYDLRYATKSFDTISDWDNAMPISSSSLPAMVASPGQPESAAFTIFDYNQTYYFAIKTTDGEHWSSISNQPQYTIKPAISDWETNLAGPSAPSISWQFELPQDFYASQPAAGPDGTVYFGASNYWTSRFYAVNPSGLEKWKNLGFNAAPSIPAVLDDSSVYFGQFDPGSYISSLDRNGNKKWEFNVGDRVNSVTADEYGNVYFTAENKWVSAVDAKGKKKWRFFNNFTFNFTPIVIPGEAYKDSIFLAANMAGLPGFYRINRETGEIIWQNRAVDNFIYFSFDPIYDKATDTLYAPVNAFGGILLINPATGVISKKIFDYGAWPMTKATVVNNLLVIGVNLAGYNPASGSAIYALDIANTASIQWKLSLDSPPINQIIKDRDNNLYFATREGKIYSITPDGKRRWVVDFGVSIGQYPVLGDKAVYIGTAGRLVKIED